MVLTCLRMTQTNIKVMVEHFKRAFYVYTIDSLVGDKKLSKPLQCQNPFSASVKARCE